MVAFHSHRPHRVRYQQHFRQHSSPSVIPSETLITKNSEPLTTESKDIAASISPAEKPAQISFPPLDMDIRNKKAADVIQQASAAVTKIRANTNLSDATRNVLENVIQKNLNDAKVDQNPTSQAQRINNALNGLSNLVDKNSTVLVKFAGNKSVFTASSVATAPIAAAAAPAISRVDANHNLVLSDADWKAAKASIQNFYAFGLPGNFYYTANDVAPELLSDLSKLANIRTLPKDRYEIYTPTESAALLNVFGISGNDSNNLIFNFISQIKNSTTNTPLKPILTPASGV